MGFLMIAFIIFLVLAVFTTGCEYFNSVETKYQICNVSNDPAEVHVRYLNMEDEITFVEEDVQLDPGQSWYSPSYKVEKYNPRFDITATKINCDHNMWFYIIADNKKVVKSYCILEYKDSSLTYGNLCLDSNKCAKVKIQL
jgi:hypothetical protein